MRQTCGDPAQFCQSDMSPHERIARLATTAAVVHHVQPVIRSKRYRAVCTASCAPRGFLGEDLGDDRNEVAVPFEMATFEKRTGHRILIAANISEMDEMDATPQPLHHTGQIIVVSRTERPGAERYPICRDVYGLDECGIVRFG